MEEEELKIKKEMMEKLRRKEGRAGFLLMHWVRTGKHHERF
jgi:hypothetical protein